MGNPALEGKKILIIDDSQTVRRSAEYFLQRHGIDVLFAADGFEALAEVVNHHPDLVFVDIMMPRLDGYQFCALIKQNPEFNSIPVVLLSSRDGVFDRARGRIAGANDYLVKPFTEQSLIAAVQAQLPLSSA